MKRIPKATRITRSVALMAAENAARIAREVNWEDFDSTAQAFDMIARMGLAIEDYSQAEGNPFELAQYDEVCAALAAGVKRASSYVSSTAHAYQMVKDAILQSAEEWKGGHVGAVQGETIEDKVNSRMNDLGKALLDMQLPARRNRPFKEQEPTHNGQCRDCGQGSSPGGAGYAPNYDGEELTHWYCLHCGSNHVDIQDANGLTIWEGTDLY